MRFDATFHPMTFGLTTLGPRAVLFAVLLATVPASSLEGAEGAPIEQFLEAVGLGDQAAVERLLTDDPALAEARRSNGTSVVTAAMFFIAKGESSFHLPASNPLLQAILARKPHLDLFDTAALGTSDRLEALLREEPSALTRRTKFGWTLLHLAAFGGNAANVHVLIRRGADVNARAESKFRNTPLQAALLCGQAATAKVLLDHGVDPLVRQARGATPMHEAALLGRQDLVELLLAHGAELSSVSDNGQTPLAEALRGQHAELAAWLRQKGAVIGIQPDEDAPAKK